MAQYSIKELEKISGIKSHTIRIWEQRYNLLNPKRTDTNIRYYDDEDVRFLLQIQVLQSMGHKISKIVAMSDEEIKEILSVSKNEELSTEEAEQIFVNRLLEAGMLFDEAAFHQTIDEVIEKIGLKNAFQTVLYQVLVKVGLLWEMGDFNPAQEHFTSSLIRDRIIIETSKLEQGTKGNYILFLPESEEHEIGLLYINFMLKYFGIKVVYLGPRVPLTALSETIKKVKPEAVYSFIIARRNFDDYKKYSDHLKKEFPKLKCYWSGAALREEKVQSDKNHIVINSIEEFFKQVL